VVISIKPLPAYFCNFLSCTKELDKKIKKLLDQIRQLEEMGGFQEAIDGLLEKIKGFKYPS
jgi:hypothetical protein